VDPLKEQLPERCVVDGEIVIALDGCLDFEALQLRLHPAASRVKLLAKETPASIVFFDLLCEGDRDLCTAPFRDRRAALESFLGRAAAPLHLVDEATLGAPLCVEGRARHGRGATALAVPQRGGGLALGVPSGDSRAEPTLDGSGTVLVEIASWSGLEPVAAAACWRAWNAATLAYLAGLAAQALELTVAHARSREQFGAPLSTIPAVQSRLADAALAVDSLALLAWASTASDAGVQDGELRHAGAACSEVTASAHQVHGALGFALESGIHVYHRRARAVHSWAVAVCDALR
jgi:hypothetical protein